MRVDVSPKQAQVDAGYPLTLTVAIANTSSIIAGYTVRILGADPGWVSLETDRISLFPEESRTLVATISVPAGLPAGRRTIAVQVRELTPPEDISITEVNLDVPPAQSVQVRLDPVTVTAGRAASYSVLVENTGNTVICADLAGDDPEGRARFEFRPPRVELIPGEHAVVDLRVRARRRLAGTPVARILNLYLDDVVAEKAEAAPAAVARAEDEAVATGAFIQRAVIARGAFSLAGLLAAATVFAIVITLAMAQLVGRSAADRDLALQVAAARENTDATGTAGLAGTVKLLTSGTPVPGVSVTVYNSSNTVVPVATVATDDKGEYRITSLAGGQYKVSYRGAGFVQLWYPGAAAEADAQEVSVSAGELKTGLNVVLGGVPATISGTVSGDDVAAAMLFLQTVGPTGGAAPARFGPPTLLPNSAPVAPPDTGGATVQSVPIGSDGTFTLSNVPSPSVYRLVVTKQGFATSSQQIDVRAGEARKGVRIALRRGDGVISGVVRAATGPLGGVTLTATAGTATANTLSLTDGDVGAFTLRDLPTPATVTIVAGKTGYASQTLTVTLGAGQKLTGVGVTLGQSAGTLKGLVTLQSDGKPAPGVTVLATDGLLSVQSNTESTGDVGSWTIGGLPVPGTYTITFSRADLAAQTVSVSLDAGGNVTPGSQGATITRGGITVAMQSATAIVHGRVTQPGGATACDEEGHIAEATVSLNSGTTTYTVTSAANRCGEYRIELLSPGTYTVTISAGQGTTPRAEVLTLKAGDIIRHDVTLPRPASITGVVEGTNGAPRCGWTVFLYTADQYPQRVTSAVVTRPDGSACRFTFPALDAGSYVLAVGPTADPATAVKTVSITVRASQQYGTPEDGTTLKIVADP